MDFNETTRGVSSAGTFAGRARGVDGCRCHRGRIDDSFIGVCAITAFLLTLPVSSIAGLVDGYLARGLPTLLRASLTAAFGMTIAVGLILALFAIMFSPTVPPEVMNGALCAGFFLLLRWACARCCRMTSVDNGI